MGMFVDFEKAFNPSDEDKRRYNKTMNDFQMNAIRQKKCMMCRNTYYEHFNNHGHDDVLIRCQFSKECVDYSDGKQCENWNPREIIEFWD